jgi:hypothetical protein
VILAIRAGSSSHQFDAPNMSSILTLISELHTWEWLAILLARLAVGLLFFLSGRSKLFVPERREQMRQTLLEAHVPFPEFNALFVSTIEFVFGLLLILGQSRLWRAWWRNDCGHSNYGCAKIKASSPLGWLPNFVPSRSALPRDSRADIPARPRLVQH